MSLRIVAAMLIVTHAYAQNSAVITTDQSAIDAGTLSGAWRIEDGAVIGRAEAGETAWLRLRGEYWDFVMEVEFQTPAPANGGVQVRGHWLPASPADGADAKTMYGYHVNVNTTEGGRTGEVLAEHGAPPLCAATDDAQKAVAPGDWNTLTVRAVGPVVQVAVNGVPAATSYDERSIGGMIALQVAAGPDAPAEVRYRNLRVSSVDRAKGWRALFDGTSLEGWKNWGTESWEVADGVIQGRRGPKQSEGYLATEETWTDFRVRGEFHMLGDGNYGLFYHSTIRLRDDGYPIIAGVQGEVEPSYPGSSGWVYESYRRGWLVQPDKTVVEAFLLRPGEWNSIEIRSEGNRLTTWINGFRVLDLRDAAPQLFAGSFALQLHTGEGAGIDWRGLYVREP